MNPFATSDKIYVSKRPQDMRADIHRLSAIAAADFGSDPTGGALYCFVSRDCSKMKAVRFEDGGACLYYVRLSGGTFKWRFREDGDAALEVSHAQLMLLLSGLDASLLEPPEPIAGKKLL